LKNRSFPLKPTAIIEDDTSLLQAFFNSTQQYQVLLNRQFEIVAFNEFACNFNRLYKQPGLEKGRSMFDYINAPHAADFKTLCDNALNGDLVEYEHFINGGWFNFTIHPLYNCQGIIEGLSLVVNNISNQKKNTKLIRQQSECLSIIAQLQSHQVRHPVSSILSLIKLLKEEENYHLKKEYLEYLETATQQLDEVIRAIVNQSRQV
jgi:signal transduction histidine kinase